MATASLIQTGLLRACPFAALLVSVSASALPAQATSDGEPGRGGRNVQAQLRHAKSARQLVITYTTHNGHRRSAYVLLPHGYGEADTAPIPLVISPHGRAVDGKTNARRWGNLPTIGRFAVVNPDGYGRLLRLHSWGFRGQIDDLARMADIVEAELPWVHIDRTRLYAVGASMGAHETLLLAGRYPNLLAGAVAVDGPADFALQYRNFPRLRCDAECRSLWGDFGRAKQRLARREIGGTPQTAAEEFAARSPLTYARAIAESCVPVQIWWSRTDDVVLDPARQSGRMVAALRAANAHAPVDEYVGNWDHTEVMHHETDLPKMLAGLRLLPPAFAIERVGARRAGPAPEDRCARR